MQFSAKAVAIWCLSLRTANAFSNLAFSKSPAFVTRTSSAVTAPTSSSSHATGCGCSACSGLHPAGCVCDGCRPKTALFSTPDDEAAPAAEAVTTATTDDVQDQVPAEVEAMDGIDSPEEAHNAERPARQQIAKKRPVKTGTALTDLEIGSTVKGKVRSTTSYGAFVDLGAQTDGLVHISQLAAGFVSTVEEIVKPGQEVEVRILSIDTVKNQIALTMLTETEEQEAQDAAQQRQDRPRRQANNRRDDSPVLSDLMEKGWDDSSFIEGTVVSTVDFGCFVRIDVSRLNPECSGQIDGLVHISALGAGRVESVSDVVSPEEKVQVRLKSINGNKVSLTMLSVEDEAAKADFRGGDREEYEGAKDWKESLTKFEETMPKFSNGPIFVDSLR